MWAKRKFSLNLTIILVCCTFMPTTNQNSSTWIEPELLSSAERLGQRVLAIRLRVLTKNQKNGKYVDRRCNCLVTRQKLNMSSKNSSFDCISTAQIRWNTKRIFNSNTGIFRWKRHLKHCTKEKLCSGFLIWKGLSNVRVCSEYPVRPRIIRRNAYQQVSEFNRSRIVTYRQCGLSSREITRRNGRHPSTVM